MMKSACSNLLRQSYRKVPFQINPMQHTAIYFFSSFSLLGCTDTPKEETSFSNHPPYAPIVSFSPLYPTTEEPIRANLIFDPVDPDGDPVSLHYSWYKNGEEQGFNGDVVEASYTQKGDIWSIRAYTFDGSHSVDAR